MAIKTIKEESLTALGNAIRAKTGSEDLLEFPNGMVDVINGFNLVPDEAFVLTGNCSYRFANNSLIWLIDLYGDKINTSNITNADSMFNQSTKIEEIPFDLNFSSNLKPNTLFTSCNNLKKLPKITNLAGGSDMFSNCNKLVSLNGNQLVAPTNTFPMDEMFYNCYSLRSIEGFLDNIPDVYSGNSIFGMYNVFQNCYSMDELVNLPYVYLTYNSSGYGFGSCFSMCNRLKEVTFRGGSVTSSSAKSTVLDLSNYVGYAYNDSYLTPRGFTSETRVTNDETYQALKDNPDWWTTNVTYSRYNHDSAVNTLNSLPDFSSLSITMTIKFKGESGSATDGGAINTLTEEEIAVATAKGWTVTLV